MAKLGVSVQNPRIPICFLQEIANEPDLYQASRLLCYVDRHFNGRLRTKTSGYVQTYLKHFTYERVQVYAQRLVGCGAMEMVNWECYVISDLSSRYTEDQIAKKGFVDSESVPSIFMRTDGKWRHFGKVTFDSPNK